MTDVNEIIQERGNRYGRFLDNATLSQQLKDIIRDGENWEHLPADMREALDMICHKIARVMCGDWNYIDNWVDIAGYAIRVQKRLETGG